MAKAYHHFPSAVRTAVDNFLSNLDEPSNAINSALQLDATATFTSFWRFTLNSTFGLAGVYDFAALSGLQEQDQNFGKTLGHYGVAEGSYLVLPLAGPSTTRDTAGQLVDWVLDPIGNWFTTAEDTSLIAANGVVKRDENADIINQFYYESLDPYTATRAAYLQHQAFTNH